MTRDRNRLATGVRRISRDLEPAPRLAGGSGARLDSANEPTKSPSSAIRDVGRSLLAEHQFARLAMQEIAARERIGRDTSLPTLLLTLVIPLAWLILRATSLCNPALPVMFVFGILGRRLALGSGWRSCRLPWSQRSSWC
jgi:hypothetical protein